MMNIPRTIFLLLSVLATISTFKLRAQELPQRKYILDLDGDDKKDTIVFDSDFSFLSVYSTNKSICKKYSCNIGVMPKTINVSANEVNLIADDANFRRFVSVSLAFSKSGKKLLLSELETETTYNMLPEVPKQKCHQKFKSGIILKQNAIVNELSKLKTCESCCSVTLNNPLQKFEDFIETYGHSLELREIPFSSLLTSYLEKYPIQSETVGKYEGLLQNIKMNGTKKDWKYLREKINKFRKTGIS